MTGKNLLSKIDIESICKLYKENSSMAELAVLFKVSSHTIRYWLIKMGVHECRTFANYYKESPLDYFENVNTEKKAYFLGLLVSDGCVSGNEIVIRLQEGDRYILEEFALDIGFDKDKVTLIPKRKETCKNQASLRFSNQKMVKDLSKYGVVPNKSHITYFPDISEEFHSHFIRGVFDGDGSISRPKIKDLYTFGICGNVELIKIIQNILVKECSLGFTKLAIPKSSCKNIANMLYTGNRQCIKIKQYVYNNATIFLTRKKDKFDEITTKWKI